MAVLADFGHQDAGPPAMARLEVDHPAARRSDGFAVADLSVEHSGDSADLRHVTPVDRLQGVADLPDRSPRPSRVDGQS